MRSARWWSCVSWSLLLAGLGGVASAADDRPIDPILAGKGLSKQGATYVLESEKPVLAKLRDARGAFKDMAAMSGQQSNNQQLAARAEALEQQRTLLQSQMDALTQQIALQPAAAPPGGLGGYGGVGGFGAGGAGGFGYGGQASGPSPLMIQREQIRQQLVQVNNEQRTVKNQTPQAKDNASLNKRVQKAEEGFKASLTDLRKQVDEVQKQYDGLEGDAAVKNALTEARKVNGRIKLGPSEAFVAATRELDKAERQFLDKKPASTAAKKKAATKGKK